MTGQAMVEKILARCSARLSVRAGEEVYSMFTGALTALFSPSERVMASPPEEGRLRTPVASDSGANQMAERPGQPCGAATEGRQASDFSH